MTTTRHASEVTPVSSEPAVLRASLTADRIGVGGSLLCALHCALMPLALSLIPTLGASWLANIDLDQAFVVFASVLGLTTLSVGYRRHRAHYAWMLLLPGLLMLWTGSFTALHDHSVAHALVMAAGGLLIAGAHLLNLRLSHRRVERPSAEQERTQTA